MAIPPYERKAHYHETDQMGMIYHANYIRWFEEARVDFMDRCGIGYKSFEQAGIYSPVLAVHAEYKSMVKFDDTVIIFGDLIEFDGIRMTVIYRVEDKATGEARCTGYTKHCFINKKGRPVSLKKAHPAFYDMVNGCVNLNKDYFAD